MRLNMSALLADLAQRRELVVRAIIDIQAREDIITTREQAERAYDFVTAKREASDEC